MLEAITKVLSAHRLSRGEGSLYNCTCMEAKFSRYRRTAVEQFDLHLAQMLVAAGLRLTPKDPREALRARIEGRDDI